MTATTPPLTRYLGTAERTLRALLEQLSDEAGLSFPEWTTLVVLDTAGPLGRDELVRQQVAGRVAGEALAAASIDDLVSSGLIASAGDDDPRLSLTAAGEVVFRPLRQTVTRITDDLYGDLPPTDLAATRRTLEEITRRATAHLAATA
ncbi:MAG TPA: hypothetical protein VK611_13005 [Acidimicrobiales bacterium]|nr:hypothetical protein [Acidimicrobiales bacterium]